MELLIMLLIALLLLNLLMVSSAAVIKRPVYVIHTTPERSPSLGCFPIVLGIFATAIILGLLVS